MTTLTPGRVFRSREPTLTVENDLAPGRHRFQLTVVDDGGLESDPAELVVTVLDRRVSPPPPPITTGTTGITTGTLGRLDPRIVVTPSPPVSPPPTPIGPLIRPIRPIR